ncbi:uridine kinase [uncultured Sunxiuqinia sp.]|uniref:uridine kinase n=1 Tax=uncultured Sunxiuqinia sp. TaxID=1573825 RepID=UPI0030DC5EB9|tara:strand:- start:14763 stop:15368 length:606 start_codon:yes stop_codon:yes gene_type:complete
MIIIGIAGGTGSGKTTVVRKIIEQLPQNEVAVISQDSYYRDSSHIPMEQRKEINFDHPDSIEFSLLTKHLSELKAGNSIEEPTYSYLTCTRQPETNTISPKSVLIVEGILVLSNASLRKLLDIKAYVDCDSDLRLSRVIRRDIIERGRDVQQVLARYEETVRPSHLQFIEPTKRFADIIIPQGGNNTVAINIFTNFIKQHL